MKIETIKISELQLDPNNARKHDDGNLTAIKNSLQTFGQRKPIVVGAGNVVVAGNGTITAAKKLGWKEIDIVRVPEEWTLDQAKAFALADNRTAELAEWDESILASQLVELETEGWDIALLGFEKQIDDDGDQIEEGEKVTLADRFVVPPFTTLDQRAGYWQERKRRWLSMGIKSEEGRGENLLQMNPEFSNLDAYRDKEKNKSSTKKLTLGSLSGIVPNYYEQKSEAEKKVGRSLTLAEFEADHLKISDTASLSSTGTSIFDPVLCELAYRWFSPDDGSVLDPFAGGSVRGIVAATLGRKYTGIDLRAEQIEANERQWAEIGDKTKPAPTWFAGDSNAMAEILPADLSVDLLFSCPPYADLEVYSDDPADISNMPYDKFMEIYRSIISQAAERLADDRFAVWVIGDVRDKKTGTYRGFVPDTIRAFEDAGLRFYNEAILVSPIGSLGVRSARMFNAGRKLGKAHQNVLVFVKGDPKKATLNCGEIEIDPSFLVDADQPE